jgi:hypothetical protein
LTERQRPSNGGGKDNAFRWLRDSNIVSRTARQSKPAEEKKRRSANFSIGGINLKKVFNNQASVFSSF